MLLHRGRLSTRQVKRALDVDRRKALDDLKALELHGVPVSPVGEGTDREWVLQPTWRKMGMQIGLEERLSLLFGREIMGSFLRETDIGDALAKLDHQIEAMSNEGLAPDTELARRFYYVREPEKDYHAHRETVRTLVHAITSGHRISFVYRAARPPRETKVYNSAAPYTLVVYKRGLYVIIDRRSDITIHAVERITDLVAHPNRSFDYPIPSDYDPTTLFGERLGLADDGKHAERVCLRFTAAARPYAETRIWMPDQEIIPRDDGGCDIVFRASGLELATRVLEYGDMVEVIAPASLRERVIQTLTGALERYRPS